MYYRLKQTDFDGTFAYSSVVVVNTKGGFEPAVSIYPNPSDGRNLKLEANFLSLAPTELKIYNQTGAVIHQLVIAPTSESTIPLDKLPALIPGSYLLLLSQDNLQVKQKLLVQ